jgi:hypothetical protein
MIVLYTSLLLLLLVVRFLVRRRAASLGRKYTRVARATDELLREPRFKPGNGGKPDPYFAAKQAYLLGQAVEKRERIEARYVAWQKAAEKVGGLVRAVRGWKGRKLPYALGVLDVLLLLGTLDYLGYGAQVNPQAVVEFLSSLIHRA